LVLPSGAIGAVAFIMAGGALGIALRTVIGGQRRGSAPRTPMKKHQVNTVAVASYFYHYRPLIARLRRLMPVVRWQFTGRFLLHAILNEPVCLGLDLGQPSRHYWLISAKILARTTLFMRHDAPILAPWNTSGGSPDSHNFRRRRRKSSDLRRHAASGCAFEVGAASPQERRAAPARSNSRPANLSTKLGSPGLAKCTDKST